jgi:hypothetical protein
VGERVANHAKLVAVDDAAFCIGSQSLYPGRLQELGMMVEGGAASAELRLVWDWSQRDALMNPGTKKCDA